MAGRGVIGRRARFIRRWGFPSLSGKWSIPGDPADFSVFLLLGQSNMAGYGGIHAEDPLAAGDFDRVPGVLVMGGQGTDRSARARGWQRWRPAAHPLHLNQRSAGFGLGLPFAFRLREQTPRVTVGLVPGAWGGAGIDTLGSGTPLYENTFRRARLAARDGSLAGILWHQGETDALDEGLSHDHAGKLTALIRQLRSDLSAPDLPVILGDLAHFGDDRRPPDAVARRTRVRDGMRAVAGSIGRAAFVETDRLAGVDGVHFGRPALVELGRRYADAWRTVAAS